MNISTSVYSLDGNSIFSVAEMFERLAIQEMSKNSEILFQGQDLTDSNIREAINFKASFDKLFSLFKEFYMKVLKGNQVLTDVIDADITEEFERRFNEVTDEKEIKNSITKFVDKFEPPEPDGTIDGPSNVIQGYLKTIKDKVNSIATKPADPNIVRLAKLDMIEKAVAKVETFPGEGFYPVDFDDLRASIIDDLRLQQNRLKRNIITAIKREPLNQTKIDANTAIRLASFEGSAFNILRDCLTTSGNMVQDIKAKRVILRQALKQDSRIVDSLTEDSFYITQYMDELNQSYEIEKNYAETYIKVVNNLDIITDLVDEIGDDIQSDDE